MAKDFLKIAGNVHLAYYIEAADKLGIKYEIVVPALMARFEHENKHWFIINTAIPVNNVPSTTIAKRKNLTALVLEKEGIPIAKQVVLENEDHAVEFYNKYKDIVIKPVQNLGGNGVSILPNEEEEVREAYRLALEKNLSKSVSKVLGEEFITGDNYRFLVCDNKVIGVAFRRPPFVVGNGKDSIKTLLETKNAERKAAIMKPTPIDEHVVECLELKDMSLDTIPDEEEVVEVLLTSNASKGGTTEECHSIVDPYYEKMAVAATKAVGLKVGGVDIIAKDITKKDDFVINEINYNPGLRVHYRVDKGDVVDVAVPIMEYIRDNYQG